MTLLHPEPKPADPQVKEEGKVAQQNIEQNINEKKIENPEQKQDVQQVTEPENPDWKAFREARKRDREERNAAEQRAAQKEQEAEALKAAMEAAFAGKQHPASPAYKQYYGMNDQYDQPEESEEQKIERKVNELFAKKEEQYKKQRAEEEHREYPKRLTRDFPDFYQVCTQENLDYLDFHYPEISRPLQRIGEGYDKWHDTYHAVKKFIPNHGTSKKEAAKIDANNMKPRSMSSTLPAPTGGKVTEAWQDTEARRAANWARMQKTMRGV